MSLAHITASQRRAAAFGVPGSRPAFLLLALACWQFVGCATGHTALLRNRPRIVVELGVETEKEANENFPIPVSMVFVYDKALLKDVAELSATQWFTNREQYLPDHAAGVYEEMLEFVPGEPVDQISRRVPVGAVQAFLFARYRVPGVNRVTFDPLLMTRLMLGHDKMAIRP